MNFAEYERSGLKKSWNVPSLLGWNEHGLGFALKSYRILVF